MVVSLNTGTPIKSQYIIILIMETPRKVPQILGNPYVGEMLRPTVKIVRECRVADAHKSVLRR